MKKVIIIGSGGLASEIRCYIRDINKHHGSNIIIKGIIDDNYENYLINKSKYNFEDIYLGTTNDFEYVNEDFFIIGFTNIINRISFIEKMEKLNLNLLTLLHPSSVIDSTAIIDEGTIVSPFCTIGPNVKIGKYNVLTSYSFISHDCTVGQNNFFSTSGLSGNVAVGDNNNFGIRSTILPSVKVGSNNIVQAGMTIDKNIKDNETVFYRYKEKVIIIKGDTLNEQ